MLRQPVQLLCGKCLQGSFMFFTIEDKVWKYQGTKACWHFITIPQNISLKIKHECKHSGTTRGMVKILAKIQQIQWKTSIFPDGKKSYILPIKSEIRKRLEISENDTIKISIELQHAIM